MIDRWKEWKQQPRIISKGDLLGNALAAMLLEFAIGFALGGGAR